MASKMTREAMIKFIDKHREKYAGNTDISVLPEMTDEQIQKVYRALKTKMWNTYRKARAQMTFEERIAQIENYDECAKLKAETEDHLRLIDERMAQLKGQKIEDLKTLINDSKNQLKELQG